MQAVDLKSLIIVIVVGVLIGAAIAMVAASRKSVIEIHDSPSMREAVSVEAATGSTDDVR